MRRHLAAVLLLLTALGVGAFTFVVTAQVQRELLTPALVAAVLIVAVCLGAGVSRGGVRALAAFLGGLLLVIGAVLLIAQSSLLGSANAGVVGSLIVAAAVGPPLLAGAAIIGLAFYGSASGSPRARLWLTLLYSGIAVAIVLPFSIRADERRAARAEQAARLEAGAAAFRARYGPLAHATGGSPRSVDDDGDIRALGFSADSRFALTAGGRTIPARAVLKVWSVATGEQLAVRRVPQQSAFQELQIAPSGDVRAFGGSGKAVRYQVPSLEPVDPTKPFTSEDLIAPRKSGPYEVQRTMHDLTLVRSEAPAEALVRFEVSSVAGPPVWVFSPDGTRFVLLDGERALLWQEGAAAEAIDVIPRPRRVAFSPDGSLLLLASERRAAIVDVDSRALLHRLVAPLPTSAGAANAARR